MAPKGRLGGWPGHVWRRTAPFVVALVLLTSVHEAGATFSSLASASHSPSAASCFYRATVQTGTTSSTGNGTTTVTISAVNTAKAFLLFSASGDQDRPISYEIGGRIASSTTVEFIRVADFGAATMSIRWYVVEYNCGVTVQRGSLTQSAATTNVTISSVGSAGDAFVTFSKTPASGDQTYGDNDPLIAELTSSTNLQIRVTAANSSHVIYWQVVAFDDGTKISVQRGSTSGFTTGVTTVNVTIGSVNTAKTFVLVSETGASGVYDDLGSGYVRGRLTSSTNLQLDRGASSGYAVPEVFYQVVTLNDGSSVQSGSATLASGTLSSNTTITAVTLARSTAFSSSQFGSGLGAGSTTYTSFDEGGNANATLSLTSTTNLSIVRTSSVGSATFAWYVVSWGLP